MHALFTPWLIWFVIGIVLAFLELVLPAFVILFFGVGCWVVAGALLFIDLSLAQQIGLFLIGTIVSLLTLRRTLMKVFKGSSPDQADDGLDDQPIGVRASVTKAISPALPGKISYRGSTWNAVADEAIETDAVVEITGYADKSRSVFRVRKI